MSEVEYTKEELAFLTLIGATPPTGKTSVKPVSPTDETPTLTDNTKAEDK
jgi:hypothetical protein